MKRRIFSMILALAVIMSLTATAWADHLTPSGSDYSVTLNSAGKLVSKLPALGAEISERQPGDDITFTIELRNRYTSSNDWYMLNEIIKSLEDETAASGGAYAYELSYKPSAGASRTLYSSDTVGGEDPIAGLEGLHEINDALKNYFFLESMPSNGTGVVTLKVKLDGESQGNSYSGANAQLRLRFASELTQSKTVVKTGDETKTLPYILGMGVSGLLILALAIDGLRQRKKRGEGRA